ncbi:uncharacterized protein RJT20DRAFT_42535 [Scheffersomyces xylosifermentans]|uniref:uncharacterized protein n=1 Tax=Scheffersomyces xylosifermentans TaxID=1304137 RepID=UPI00315D04B2
MISTLIPEDFWPYFDYLPDRQRAVNLFMTFTPLFSYGTTCYSIYRKQTSMGFSLDICVTMLMAATLRIYYYVISPYEVTLLRQSLVMVVIQCVLLKVSLSYRPSNYDPELLTPLPKFRNELNSFLPRRLSASTYPVEHESYYIQNSLRKSVEVIAGDVLKLGRSYLYIGFKHCLRLFDVYYQRPLHFWQWKEEAYYWRFVGQFVVIFGVLTAIFRNNSRYGEFIGILGLFIESLLPLPQILLLDRLRSVTNFKVILLLSWLGGDLTKLGYLIYGTDNVSVIFIVAGLFQMTLDIYIAFQYIHYKYHGNEDMNEAIEDNALRSQDLNELVEELVKHEDSESILMKEMNLV